MDWIGLDSRLTTLFRAKLVLCQPQLVASYDHPEKGVGIFLLCQLGSTYRTGMIGHHTYWDQQTGSYPETETTVEMEAKSS